MGGEDRPHRERQGPASPSYLPFVSWGALDPDAEAEIFSRFWTWMTELRDATLAESAICSPPTATAQRRTTRC